MILSGAEIHRRAIRDPAIALEAKGWWAREEWGTIQDQILIYPFRENCIGICCYDLCVGEQYISLRDPYEVRQLGPDATMEVAPGETVLVLTEEFIALPRNLMGLVVPRARRIFEGGLINATRVDPTWYGKLIIGFTNLAKYPSRLHRGDPFCTCFFMESQVVAKTAAQERAPGLGRESLRIETPNLRYRPRRTAESITAEDLANLVDAYGPPYDILVGGLHQSRAELIAQVERDVAPNIVRQAVSEAKTSAFGWLLTLFGILIAGLLAILAKLAGLY